MSAASPKKTVAVKKPAEHPTYIEMVVAAIAALKERKGSSRQAILKYIQANYKVSESCNLHIKLSLKRGVAAGRLIQAKGTGASGSFKNAKPEVKPKTKVVKKVAAKKPAAKKPAAKKPAAKKTAKKATPKKSTPAKKAAPAPVKKTSAKKGRKPAKKAAAPAPAPAKKAPAKKPTAKKPASKKTPKKSKK